MRIHAALPGKDLIKQNLILPKLQYNLSVYNLGDFWIHSSVVEFQYQHTESKASGFPKNI